MEKLLKIDSNGFLQFGQDLFVEDENIPGGYTDIQLPVNSSGGQIPFYRPRLVNGQWIESMAQEEIDTLNNAPRLPTIEEQLAKVKEENELLKIRDAGMQEDINFIYETLGG